MACCRSKPAARANRLSFIGCRYTINGVIQSFRDAETEKIFHGVHSRKFGSIEKVALRKMIQLNRAIALQDLSALPGNRLEALTRNRKGQHSIRVNDQYRICFRWSAPDAFEVEITDYHD